MSASGDQRPSFDPLVASAAECTPRPSGEADEQASGAGALPLRLSVTQGGLGLELSAPLVLGALVVRAFEVSLIGIRYPVDLSKGVKQFRNRRSRLVRARVTLDLEALATSWAARLTSLWGTTPRVRLRAVTEETHAQNAEQDRNKSVEALAVTICAQELSLAFDLVVASGNHPCFIIDAPRVWGPAALAQRNSPLHLALRVVDTCSSEEGGGFVHRSGRVLELSGLAQALALSVFPHLGCRLPEIVDQVIVGIDADRGELSIELGAFADPFFAGRRAMRAATAALVLKEGDAALASGAEDEARTLYLEALELAPGHPDILLELAELELAAGERTESVLAFLEELDAAQTAPVQRSHLVRRHLCWSRALATLNRSEASRDALLSAAQFETDSVFLALFGLELSERFDGSRERRTWLDEAVSRAPFLPWVRRARLTFALNQGDVRTAQSDAEQLESLMSSNRERAQVCLEVGDAYFAAGHGDSAQTWYRRALRFRPDDADVRLALARGLLALGEPLRALDVLASTLRHLEDSMAALSASDGQDPEQISKLAELRAVSHFDSAELLLEFDENVPDALAHLAAVTMRSSVGVRARLREAQVFHASGNSSKRDRALFRALQAVESGWVSVRDFDSTWKEFLARVEPELDPSLRAFATRILPDT